ncbi:hypothetical protein K503DRAFT_806483 [Rhizopogon vinicolor AM-OR11-026]|uniref:Uncharacterized protein n=1 Tax=Rhizopogon vinicolor AM-OR11-026 TaxID=1314800 RepID=A0A1B7MEH3_9AGAM|nr:hypothetical protein K503DRAFT_806483 [Rhizopogon vinicolor AM-OR11-026]
MNSNTPPRAKMLRQVDKMKEITPPEPKRFLPHQQQSEKYHIPNTFRVLHVNGLRHPQLQIQSHTFNLDMTDPGTQILLPPSSLPIITPGAMPSSLPVLMPRPQA